MKKFLASCCLALFVLSFSACPASGPGDVKKTDAANQDVPAKDDGTKAETEE